MRFQTHQAVETREHQMILCVLKYLRSAPTITIMVDPTRKLNQLRFNKQEAEA